MIQVRSEYQKYHTEQDLEALEDALMLGRIQLKRLNDMVGSLAMHR